MPNGIHAIVIEPELCRVQLFRYEHTYDVLITRHWLPDAGGRRPQMQSEVLFFHRAGTLKSELWGKDSDFGVARRHVSSSAMAMCNFLRRLSSMCS